MRLALSATFTTYTESSHVELGSYKDRDGRTLANDRNPEAIVTAYPEIFRVLKPDSFCVTFYGYPKLGAFVPAWAQAGKAEVVVDPEHELACCSVADVLNNNTQSALVQLLGSAGLSK